MELTDVTIKFIKEHLADDPSMLALQANKYPGVNMIVAISQIAGKKMIVEKIPSWSKVEGLIYPKHLSLEQCSSEATARYKSSLVKGSSLVDLTGGFGIDCAFLSVHFSKVTYVERQQELCDVAAPNFTLLGLTHILVVNGDGVDYLSQMEEVDWLYIDPARRNRQGGKAVAIEECEPNVAELSEQLIHKAGQVMIKLSPMLDLSLALHHLPFTKAVHVVSVANECKELLIILGKERQNLRIPIHCVNILKNGKTQTYSFNKEEESEGCEYAQQVRRFIYEPNASILKAGAYKSVARSYHLKKLHPNSHLYTSDDQILKFPGRIFVCDSVFSLNKKEIKTNLREIKKANITVRNFPLSVAELRKRLKLSDGGEVYLFATTLMEGQKALIKCHKL